MNLVEYSNKTFAPDGYIQKHSANEIATTTEYPQFHSGAAEYHLNSDGLEKFIWLWKSAEAFQ
jgi:hypothetical protein